jgi:hypothetical protein
MPFNEDGTRKNTMAYKKGRAKSSTFQMKGNPMQRNFGIGSPVSRTEKTKTTLGDKIRAAGKTFVTHLDPDEKIGDMSLTYQLHKKELREKRKKGESNT